MAPWRPKKTVWEGCAGDLHAGKVTAHRATLVSVKLISVALKRSGGIQLPGWLLNTSAFAGSIPCLAAIGMTKWYEKRTNIFLALSTIWIHNVTHLPDFGRFESFKGIDHVSF
jgi:hypothetical protein